MTREESPVKPKVNNFSVSTVLAGRERYRIILSGRLCQFIERVEKSPEAMPQRVNPVILLGLITHVKTLALRMQTYREGRSSFGRLGKDKKMGGRILKKVMMVATMLALGLVSAVPVLAQVMVFSASPAPARGNKNGKSQSKQKKTSTSQNVQELNKYISESRENDSDFNYTWEVLRPQIELGKTLQRRRYQLGWSQRVLAEKIGTSQSYIYRLENGQINPTISTLQKLAHVLGLSLDLEIKEADSSAEPLTLIALR